ncbi:hypothetical protein IFM89_024682 [Coptis chinensis]|uniref:Uncharacterized protein n=1 Tax=Coptis chinensis TaxID=261450 RepID=A0A835M0Y7_9MAGN|nr:hypothetical protein IFM89_024682 [Coptis chinensis]
MKEKSIVLPVSKWAREDDISDDEDKRNTKGLGRTYSSSRSDGPGLADEIDIATDVHISSHSDSTTNEEQRQKLRHMEVALLEYCEYLEEQGIKSVEEIEMKLANCRKWLESEFGLSSSNQDGTWNSKQLYPNLKKFLLKRFRKFRRWG